LETLDKLGIGDYEQPGPPLPGTLTLADAHRWLVNPLKENRRPEAEAIERKLTPYTPGPGINGSAPALCDDCGKKHAYGSCSAVAV
jgi:hypothetical protein